MAERTLTLQFLQLFHIIIVTLMFLMNVIKTLLFLGCNSGGSLSTLITYSLAGKVGLSAKVAPSVTAFLVCNAVKPTIVVFINPLWDTIQHCICFFGTNAKH